MSALCQKSGHQGRSKERAYSITSLAIASNVWGAVMPGAPRGLVPLASSLACPRPQPFCHDKTEPPG